MKKKFLIIGVVLLSLVFTSCAKAKAEDLIAGKISEKIIETATGGKVSVDLNSKDEVVTMETEDGKITYGESLPWPQAYEEKLPKLEGISIASHVELGEERSVNITFSGLTIEEARAYVVKLKSAGFKSQHNTNSTYNVAFSGIDKQGDGIVFFFGVGENEDFGGGSLSFTKAHEDYVSDASHEDLDDGDAELDSYEVKDFRSWPRDYISELPELKGDIHDLTATDESIMIIYKDMKKEPVEDFIAAAKAAGFSEKSYETKTPDGLIYGGEDGGGRFLLVTWNEDGSVILQMKR